MSYRQRILIVDDEELLRSFLTTFLLRKHFDIREAKDGLEALQEIERSDGAFDLIITDIRMPRMDGTELAHAIASRYPAIPVLFISGFVSEMDYPRRGPQRWDFLQKPFPAKTLVGRIAALLDGAASKAV